MTNTWRAIEASDNRAQPLLDPRDGDIETDASSTESRSLLGLAGSLLVEVSLPKMLVAVVLLVVMPAILLGLAPLVATIWWGQVWRAPGVGGFGAVILMMALGAVAWIGVRRLLRIIERSFWSLNAMALQPTYVVFREGFAHLSGLVIRGDPARGARIRAVSAAFAGVVIFALALIVVRLLWRSTHWVGTLAELRTPHWLALTALANAIAVASVYLAVASLVWGVTDATMPQPRELTAFRPKGELVRSWRIAHLSDVHAVGEHYGYRLGSGRAGPRGNDALIDALGRLDALHRREPLDAVVITGDLTDAGTATEFAELLDAFAAFPRLAPLLVALPGNHDVNIVDRANPARLDLPTSPKKRLRELRTLSALDTLHGRRIRVIDHEAKRLGDTFDSVLWRSSSAMIDFADRGSRRRAKRIDDLWASAFPMVRPPERDDGLGIIALNSNAESHFSFTNALGFMTAEQAHGLDLVMRQYPRAYWIVALHHHLVEHPSLGHGFATRVSTTLVNGNWFTRRLRAFAERTVVMHGHRHIDWIGECGGLTIISAPSSTMPSSGADDAYFCVHTIGVDASGRMTLAAPERVMVHGAPR